MTDKSPVKSGFWGTQRNEKPRPTPKKLLATCLLGGSLLPTAQPGGKVKVVQGE